MQKREKSKINTLEINKKDSQHTHTPNAGLNLSMVEIRQHSSYIHKQISYSVDVFTYEHRSVSLLCVQEGCTESCANNTNTYN